MKVGFTGTQYGMTVHQLQAFTDLMKELEPEEFHHGDCIGSDNQAHDIFREMFPKKWIVVHPPLNPKKRAFALFPKKVLDEKEYLQRNQDIVDVADVLVATPDTKISVQRSGTWATVRYAARQKKPTILIFPDGIMEKRHFND